MRTWYTLLSATILAACFSVVSAYSQVVPGISSGSGLMADGILTPENIYVKFNQERPLFSFIAGGKTYTSSEGKAGLTGNSLVQVFDSEIKVTVSPVKAEINRFSLLFENISGDTVSISNVLPYAAKEPDVYITGMGPADLARAYLFSPHKTPVRVILPDNAWELGYCSFVARGEKSVAALTRRVLLSGGIRKRYETLLPPRTSVTYILYSELFEGEWQTGLRTVFRDKYLYDLEKFDNSMFERNDLAWIRNSYLIVLQMAWDREFYDRFGGKYNYAGFLRKYENLYGTIDVFGIWPTWPRLGLDERNQWDMYRDLKGGTEILRQYSGFAHSLGTKFFIAYNPWDNSTRKEDHYRGMADLIARTDADGVVLDTRGSSSLELQRAADSVKPGVVMYSEGMAVTRDMPGIISGRVHNAIFLSPELNLNKLIKPDFAIFRVCDVGEDVLQREIAIAFFNGYGSELNMFRPGGRNETFENDLEFLGRTTFILRQNSKAFNDLNWTPLVSTEKEKVYVNSWTDGRKKIFTILNMDAAGAYGKVFRHQPSPGCHWVSLYRHVNIETADQDGFVWPAVAAEGWDPALTATRSEGSVDCIAELPVLLETNISGGRLKIHSNGKGKVIVWKGNPSYSSEYKDIGITADTVVTLSDFFGVFEGKVVVQLLEAETLIDENILEMKGGKPWLISQPGHTNASREAPPGMVKVPGAELSIVLSAEDEFIPYPDRERKPVKVESFYIDRHPVTNEMYYDFINQSGYKPADTSMYLRHWQGTKYRKGEGAYPVVYLSIEDMQAYARWAGKRLPTENEWQLAAQGTDGRKWPWGNDSPAKQHYNASGRISAVGLYKAGRSQYGAEDMVGNVWQMTSDIYFNGTNYFGIIRGGSYYKPESSWWYIRGGPQPLDKTQMLLLTAPGLDRCSTVGFRCVKD